MADVQPFRALRYDESVAGPLDQLVAPPYDVISDEQREELASRSPYNVVRLTLPENDDAAAVTLAEWRGDGVLVEEEPSVWALRQEYVGPDGVSQRREGIVASLRVEPYESGVVLPHERTHAGPKEERLRLLRATGVQLEPIFLLYDGEAPLSPPDRTPDLTAEGASLWRLDDDGSLGAFFADRQLLIADGHHRYETALAYAAEVGTPEAARMPVVLVSTSDPGLTIFPTHRVFARSRPGTGRPFDDVAAALGTLEQSSFDHSGAVLYRDHSALLIAGRPGELDVQLVDRFGHEGIAYTPDWRDAVGRVDRDEAALAVLLRPTRIEDVFEFARRGEVLPQKTTYFFPKLLSGLLFHPVR